MLDFISIGALPEQFPFVSYIKNFSDLVCRSFPLLDPPPYAYVPNIYPDSKDSSSSPPSLSLANKDVPTSPPPPPPSQPRQSASRRQQNEQRHHHPKAQIRKPDKVCSSFLSLSLVRSQSLIEEEGGEGEREAGTGIPFGTKKTAKKFWDPKINFCNAVRPSESNKDFFFLSPFQNLKNQIMTTNLWVEQVQWQL